MLAVLISLAGVLVALQLPEVGVPSRETVDFPVVEELAGRKAQAEWPGCRPGPVVPYVDETGATVAYMFHFRTDGREFPEYEQVATDVREERRGLTMNTDITRWTSDYGHILVSARSDRAPILRYGYGASAFYAVGAEARARAVERLGPDVHLTRMYCVFPRTWFEFASPAGKRVVISVHFDEIRDSRAAFVAERNRRRQEFLAEYEVDERLTAEIHRAEWEAVAERDFTDYTDYFVSQVDRAPYYDWSYGCTPTAAAMVLGYIDRVDDFGRLVDWFWHRYDMVEGQMDWQIPNVQRECAIAMHTDTTTGGTYVSWIGVGLTSVAGDNGYSCNVVEEAGSSMNDWAWSRIMSEINADYSHVWSASWEVHSLACYGYRTPDKEVFVHNTWWAPGEFWSHSGSGWSHVHSPHMSGGDAHKLELTYPLGDTGYGSIGQGEVLQVGETIDVTWDNSGPSGTRVDIDMSTNGGLTWSSLAAGVPDNGSYAWDLLPSTQACDSVRLRLKQYDGSTYSSGDGSFGCFRIIREPIPPVQVAPPNGQQIFDPPIVLGIESPPPAVDSVEFAVTRGTDTIWKEKSVALTCSLPDTLFTYGRSYKWIVRAHNDFGWGEFSSFWSFWVRFSAVEEQDDPGLCAGLGVAGVNRLAEGVVFQVGRPGVDGMLVIYDALGTRLRTLPAARTVVWDSRDGTGRTVSAGLYFARLESADWIATTRFLLVE